jgi:asparagine synthase (glutamine-hydrolysing)
MTGLAAVFHRDGRPVSKAAVGSMLAAVPYLGLDGSSAGVWGTVGLGIAKTCLTAEERNEQQPLVSPRTGCVIVADARLDNRPDLLAELKDQPKTATDAELILRAYEAWGDRAAMHLFGDFAFVIWDPNSRRVVCGRDSSGERPLYYRLDQHTFVAASEIHQLLQDPSVTVGPNEDRIRDYLSPYRAYRNDQEQAATFFEGIYALQAGRILTVDASTHRIRRYWDLGQPEEIRYRRSEDYVEHFRELLLSAVAVRLRSSEPIGAALSGGLDSTSVVCAAQRVYELGAAENHGFVSYSLAFDGLECDESRYIRDVQARWGFEARFFDAPDFRNLNIAYPGFLPGPTKCPFELDLMLAEADRDGVRSVLTGHYGDNCFATSPFFYDSLLARGRIVELLHHVQYYRQVTGASLGSVMGEHVLLPLLPLKLQRRLQMALVQRQFAREQADLVPSWVPEETASDLRERHLATELAGERARRFSSERESIYRSLYPVETIPVSPGHSSRVLRPFADRRLHQFVLGIPPEQHFQPHPYERSVYAGGKLILRRAMAGILPESVRCRTDKPHFASVVMREFQEHWPDFQAAFGPGGKSEIAERGYVNRAGFWERLQLLREGEFAPDGVYVMRMLNLETWLRTQTLPRGQRTTVRPPGDTLVERDETSDHSRPVVSAARRDSLMQPSPAGMVRRG